MFSLFRSHNNRPKYADGVKNETLSFNGIPLLVFEGHGTYFTHLQDKAVDQLVQPADSKAPAQPPTIRTGYNQYLIVTAKKTY